MRGADETAMAVICLAICIRLCTHCTARHPDAGKTFKR